MKAAPVEWEGGEAGAGSALAGAIAPMRAATDATMVPATTRRTQPIASTCLRTAIVSSKFVITARSGGSSAAMILRVYG